MLSHQIYKMRAAVDKVLQYPRPPARLIIRRKMAEYLGVVAHTSPPIERPPGTPFLRGRDGGSLVSVDVADLYAALKNARGIDEQDSSGEERDSVPVEN